MWLFSEQKWINILLLVSLAILMLSGVLATYQNSQILSANKSVLHTEKVLDEANLLRIAIFKIENNHAAKDFETKILAYKYPLEDLKHLTIDNPKQQKKLHKLEPLLNSQITFYEGNFFNNKANTANSSISQIYNLINDFTLTELKLLEVRNLQLSKAIAANNVYLIMTLFFCFFTILLSGYLLNHHLYNQRIIETKLRESENYNSTILQSASDSIITLDENAEILSCNKQALGTFHYSSEEIYHKNIDGIIPNLSKHLSSLIGKNGQEVIGKTSGQRNIYGEISLSQATLAGKIIYICIFRDISERRKIDKMKNEFISTVSHELRTPLTAIHGSIILLLNDVTEKLTPETVELLDVAKRNAERLVRLINDILDVEKIESGNMELNYKILEVNACAQEAIETNKINANKYSIDIQFFPSPTKVYVYADHDKLQQVFTNLLSNAIKFSPKNDYVSLSIIITPENYVRVKISDHGPGISEEFKNRIFQKFAQEDASSNREHEGTGLGLSITKSIIEILHGKINYISDPLSGTTFYFDLPVYVPVDYNISAEQVIYE